MKSVDCSLIKNLKFEQEPQQTAEILNIWIPMIPNIPKDRQTEKVKIDNSFDTEKEKRNSWEKALHINKTPKMLQFWNEGERF